MLWFNRLFFTFNLFFALLFYCFFDFQKSFAVEYTYTFDGSEIFEVVVDDQSQAQVNATNNAAPLVKKGSSATTNIPGIYKLNAKTGNPEPLILGHLPGVNRAYKGILRFVSSEAGLNSANEALALVDGQITLFNYNSTPKKPQSYLKIGGGSVKNSSIPLVDIWSGRSIEVPVMSHPENITILEAGDRITESGGKEKLYLISLKSPNQFGSGLTFSLIVRISGKQDTVKVVRDRGVILSYDYMDDKQLDRLKRPKGDGNHFLVISPLIIEGTKNQLLSSQSPMIYRWKLQLERSLRFIVHGKKENKENKNFGQKDRSKNKDTLTNGPLGGSDGEEEKSVFTGVPQFDLTDHKQVLFDYPVEFIVRNEAWRSLVLAYDPILKKFNLVDVPPSSQKEFFKQFSLANGDLSFMSEIDVKKESIQSSGDLTIDRDPKSGQFLIEGTSWDPLTPVSGDSLVHAISMGVKPLAARKYNDAFFFFSLGRPFLAVRSSETSKYAVIDLSTIPLANEISIDGKLEFIRTGLYRFGHRNLHVFLISTKKNRSKNGSVWNLILEEGHPFRVLKSEALMQNVPFVSEMELILRSLNVTPKDPFFDSTTPVAGHINYMKETQRDIPEAEFLLNQPRIEGVRTTPYRRLLSEDILDINKSAFFSTHGDRTYFRAPINRAVIPNYFYFIQFEGKDAKDAGGFWSYQSQSMVEHKLEARGQPLIHRQDRLLKTTVTHHLEDRVLDIPKITTSQSMTPVRLLTLPFTSSVAKAKKDLESLQSFNLGLLFSTIINGQTKGFFKSVDFDIPFKSLVYSKVIQGEKAHANEFYILLFFRQDQKIAGSKNAVFLISGKINGFNQHFKSLEVGIVDKKKIFDSFVGPQDYKKHLLVNAEGSYYWTENPSAALTSSERKIRQLSQPEKYVVRSDLISSLRPVDLVNDSDVSYSNRRLERGGLWALRSVAAVKNRVQGMQNLVVDYSSEMKGAYNKSLEEVQENSQTHKTDTDNNKEKSESHTQPPLESAQDEKLLYDRFDQFLDGLVGKSTENSPIQVIIVESPLKEDLKKKLFQKLVRKRGSGGRGNEVFSLFSNQLDFYYADKTLDDVEVANEMREIADIDKRSVARQNKSILFIESDLLTQHTVTTRNSLKEAHREDDRDSSAGLELEEEELKWEDPVFRFPHDQLEQPADFLSLLVSGGMAKTPQGVKKLKKHQFKTPRALTIMTMAEFREFKKRYRAPEYSGFFDRLQLNFEFLTSPWTMWNPKSARLPEDIKVLQKEGVYHPEEMEVFPSLQRILVEASKGHLKSQQKIIIVPPELLPIVNKLTWLSWLAPDSKPQSWSYKNRHLALFRLGSTASQSQLQEYFRSVVGASATRNAVLIGDLATVERLGRPFNAKGERNYFLYDPLGDTSDFLFTQAEQALIANSDTSFPTAKQERTSSEEEVNDQPHKRLEALNDEIADIQQDLSTLNLEESGDNESDGIRSESQRDFHQREKDLEMLISARDKLTAEIEKMAVASESSGIGMSSEGTDGSAPGMKSDARILPHAIWLIGGEGKAIQPKPDKAWRLHQAIKRQATTILFGTEEELQRIMAELEFEKKFFDLKEHFQIEYLEPPSHETKVNLINSLFSTPEIQSISYQFSLNKDPNVSEMQARQQLIHQFVNRVSQIAGDLRLDQTTAFVKTFIALKNSLVEDTGLRRSRRIDENAVDRIFTRVFPMPLNVNVLEDNDPMRKVYHRVDEAIRKLDELGYRGSPELKRTFLETYVSQTRPTDSSRPIPNSQILFGATSSGKTLLIEKFFQFLGLIEYVPNKQNNEEADYIFVNVGSLTEKETSDPSKRSVERFIEDVYDLLSQPKGPRAHIVFDDFHKAVNVEIKKRLLQFIQGLFDAKGGMILVRSKKGDKVREIPVKNLNIYMTLNPETNESKRRQYIDESKTYEPAEKLKREVLAAIADQGFSPEESILARWADTLNLSHFPRTAKVPELAHKARETAKNTNEGVVIVHPDVITLLADFYANANARSLLAPAVDALTHIPVPAEKSSLYLVTKRRDLLNPTDEASRIQSIKQKLGTGGVVNAAELKRVVRELTQIDPVKIDRMDSFLDFVSYLMGEFRLQLIYGLVLKANMTDLLKIELSGQSKIVRNNFIIGLSDHVLKNVALPKWLLSFPIESLSFMTKTQVDELQDLLKSYQPENLEQRNYFPLNVKQGSDRGHIKLGDFIKGQFPSLSQQESRRDVISRYRHLVKDQLALYLHLFLRLSHSEQLSQLGREENKEDQLAAWFKQLPAEAPEQQAETIYEGLIELFKEFMVDFNSESLADAKDAEVVSATYYDQVRLFAYMIDQAVLDLPWARVSQFLLDVLDLARDYQYGSLPSYKDFLSTQPLSPFGITTTSSLAEMGDHARNDARMTVAALESRRTGFNNMCTQLLARDGGKK